MKQLLFSVTAQDCEMHTYISPGNGGQKKNRTKSGVRLIHRLSGAVGQCSETRSQIENKRIAFMRMVNTPAFQNWHKIESARRLGHKSVDQIVDEKMARTQDFKIEVKNSDGRWTEATRDSLSLG